MPCFAKRLKRWTPVAAATAVAAALGFATPAAAQAPRPNILVIVADDLGYSDIGAFGGEIRTPNLDALARRGVKLTGFHTAPTCSPTRSMLLTGIDNHEAGLGSMAETINFAAPQLRGRPGYEGYLNERADSLAERLKAAGYMTLMAGKWHLGLTEETSPAAQGFDRSFALLQGSHDHFGDDQTGKWVEAGAAATYRQDGKIAAYPVGQFSSDVFTDRMVGYLKEAKAAERPFFAYLAYTEPHWPLQAPAEDVARYKGKYDMGYEALRDQRLGRMRAMGLASADAKVSPISGVKPWAELTPQERAESARKMEIYAAMVDHMDQSIGRVLQALKANGQLDNTLIVFMSDNGADGNAHDGPIGKQGPVKGEAVGLDNRFENMGRRNSFVAYGRGWALAASAPAREIKGSTFEGGIRTTAIVAGPGVKGGRTENALLHVMDIAPTVVERAGAPAAPAAGKLPMRGKSWAGLLSGAQTAVRGPQDTLGWELFFNRAVRQGDWKAVYATPPLRLGEPLTLPAKGEWSLYNLAADPGETENLAAREPERLKAMTAAWAAYAAETGVVVPEAR